jgi:asparagine synthase (glutamine-hydrolysing)
MYAIALHDPTAGRLVLARDPFGIKPLYYAETPQYFAFASEPQALIQAGIVEGELAAPARNELLQMQFTTGRDTIFAGIKRVLPGETIVVRQGRIVERRREDTLPAGEAIAIDEEEALRRLDAALADSILVHQRSDVPFGMFLSGGIDSTAVLVMMARLAKRPVRTFTVGFAGSDDRRAAGGACRRSGGRRRACRDPVRRGRFLAPAAGGRRRRRRPRDRLRDAADLQAGRSGACRWAQGDPVGRRWRRTVRRLRPLPQRHAAVVGRRPDAAGARHPRRFDLLRGEMAGWRDGIAAAEALATGAAAADCRSRRRWIAPTGCRTICWSSSTAA